MGKPQRPERSSLIRDHGERVVEAANLVRLHTLAHERLSEAGQMQEERILAQAIKNIRTHLDAIEAILNGG